MTPCDERRDRRTGVAPQPASSGQHRLLILTPAFPPSTGGIERTAGEIAGGLSDHCVEVVAGRPPVSRGMSAPSQINVNWARNEPPGGRRAAFALLALALRVGLQFRPDLVLTLHARAMPAARALARLTGARTMLVVHAKEVPEQPGLVRAAANWADAVVCVSDYSRQLALAAGAACDRVKIIHPGVTLPVATPLPLRARPGPPTIVTVSRISDSHKGHDVALAAMDVLRSTLPNARWIMAGIGALRDELIGRAAALGLSDCVSFPGAITDRELATTLESAHVFCLLSRQPPDGKAGDGFGIAFIEAGAHGLPVVAGRVPGVMDAVQDGVNGLLVNPSDPSAVAQALLRLLSDRQAAQRLASGGQLKAHDLSWPQVVNRYRSVIGHVLESPPRARSCREIDWIRELATGPAH